MRDVYFERRFLERLGDMCATATYDLAATDDTLTNDAAETIVEDALFDGIALMIQKGIDKTLQSGE